MDNGQRAFQGCRTHVIDGEVHLPFPLSMIPVHTVTLPKSPHRWALVGTLFTTIVVYVNIILPVLLGLT
jgi:hypothetical protein